MGLTSWDFIYNCIEATSTELGSSKEWPKTFPLDSGLGMLDATDPNNKFKDWNVAVIGYCDGGFHQGLNENPSYLFSWFYKRIYFRGDTNTRVIFKHLLET